MTRQVEKLQSATTSARLKRELEELEQGGVSHTLAITNFLRSGFCVALITWMSRKPFSRRGITLNGTPNFGIGKKMWN